MKLSLNVIYLILVQHKPLILLLYFRLYSEVLACSIKWHILLVVTFGDVGEALFALWNKMRRTAFNVVL